MIVAYLFTFFLVILIVLFLLVPFLRQDKSTSVADSVNLIIEDESPHDKPLDLGRDEDGSGEQANNQIALAPYDVTSHDIEIEVAVTKARRRKSTFGSKCSQCGHQMQTGDRFCASCGTSVQSS
ncbi:MAG: zinc ribbon domain-containing protein [Abditibacteriaceae bacterium]